jgi:predicted nucleic acid-binding protein
MVVSGFSLADIDEALGELASLAEVVEVRFCWRPQLRDPGDELVLEASVNGRVDALVTHNVRDFADAAPFFGLRVARPSEIVGAVGS